MEVVSVLSDLGNGHICLFKDGPQCLKDGIGLDPALFNGLLEGFCLLLCDFILFLWREMQVDLLLLLLLVLLLAVILLILGVLLFQTHEVGLKEVVLPPHMLNVLEVTLELLGELLNSQQLLALLRCLQLSF